MQSHEHLVVLQRIEEVGLAFCDPQPTTSSRLFQRNCI